MPSLILPCTFDELPRDVQRFLQRGIYIRLDRRGKNLTHAFGSIMDKFNPHPFDKILFPVELLAKPEYREFIKETHSISLRNLDGWKYAMWQDNERQLDSVPNGYRENGMLRFRENERQYNKKAEEIRLEIDEVFSGKRERTTEVREFLSKKEEAQKQWFDKFLKKYQLRFNINYHTDIITL